VEFRDAAAGPPPRDADVRGSYGREAGPRPERHGAERRRALPCAAARATRAGPLDGTGVLRRGDSRRTSHLPREDAE
jgi:hypothetical protein